MTIIWFTYQEDLKTVDEVQRSGHKCLLATSEIVIRQLAAQHPDSIILIGHDIPQNRTTRLRQSFTTLHLKPEATSQDILTEIGLIMGRQKPAN